jgi:methyl-accepting chemotaxis protein
MKSITRKIALLVTVCSSIACLITASFMIFQLYSSNREMLGKIDSIMRDNFDFNARLEVETALSSMRAVEKLAEKGIIKKSDSRTIAMGVLRELRYNNEGYFWADTPKGDNLVLYGSKTEGTNRFEARDAKGKYMVKEIIEKGMSGGGYADYWFPKKGETEPKPKRSYSAYSDIYDVVVGTGNYIDDIDTAVSAERERLKKALMKNIFFLTAATGIILAVIISIGLYYGRRIAKPVTVITKEMISMSKYDFSESKDIDIMKSYNDEIGKMAESMKLMKNQVTGILDSIKDASSDLSSSSDEMSASTVSFSHNAQSQAASAEEITASMEELSAGMDSIAQGADNQYDILKRLMEIHQRLNENITKLNTIVDSTGKLTRKIADDARSGETSIRNMNESMSKIFKSSDDIRGIITIISEISDKINLLSLNAAIEAARAGDAGRGFAVVADEISKLAEQTASSIKEIENLIQINAREMETARTDVAHSINTTSGIIEGVTGIDSTMNEILSEMKIQSAIGKSAEDEVANAMRHSETIKNATSEQKIAAGEVVTSISSINDSAQSIAGGSEELAGNAENLASLAEKLRDSVGVFKTEGLKNS